MNYWLSYRKDEGVLGFVLYLNTSGLPSNQTKTTKTKTQTHHQKLKQANPEMSQNSYPPYLF